MKIKIKDRIKELRKKKGMTQGELGEVLGITQTAISLIEKGESNVSALQIEMLSEFFEVSADYLIFGNENIKPIEHDFLRIIRNDKTVYDALVGIMKSKNHLERLVA